MAKSVFQMLLDVKTRGANNIKKLGNSLQGAQGQAKNLAMSFNSMVGPLAAIAGIAGGAALTRGIFGSTAQLQSQAKSLEVLTGSAQTTAEILKEIRAFGAATPFQVKDLIDVTKKLKAFGVETDDLVETTRRLGDVAGATGADLDGIATAFGQIRAKGKFSQEENLQLLERGVDLTGELGKMYDMNGEQLAKAMTKGQISFEAANVALRRLTNEGGEYFGGAVSQSETLNGKLSTMLDGFNNLGINVGTVLEPTFKAFLNTTIQVVTMINNMFTEENIRKAQEFLGTLLGNMPKVVEITKILLKVTAAYAGILVGITAGKFFTVLLANMGKLVKITRALLSLEKLKLGVIKAQAVLQAALSGAITIKGTPLLTFLLAGGSAAAAFAGLNTLTDNIINNIQNKFKDATGSIDLTALLGGDLTIPDLRLATGGTAGTGGTDDPERKANLKAADRALSRTGKVMEMLDGLREENSLLNATLEGKREEVELEIRIDNLTQGLGPKLSEHVEQILRGNAAIQDRINDQEDLNNKTDKYKITLDQIKDTLADQLTSAIEGLIDGTKTLGESLSGVLRTFASMFLKAGMGSFVNSFFADGGVVANNKIVPFAYGGVVNRPTLFPMANGMGLMGEAGAEAIMPLRRGRGGRLGVEAAGGGASNVVVNVDASGSSVEGNGDQAAQLGKAIGIAVQQELIKQKRPGGLLTS